MKEVLTMSGRHLPTKSGKGQLKLHSVSTTITKSSSSTTGDVDGDEADVEDDVEMEFKYGGDPEANEQARVKKLKST